MRAAGWAVATEAEAAAMVEAGGAGGWGWAVVAAAQAAQAAWAGESVALEGAGLDRTGCRAH